MIMIYFKYFFTITVIEKCKLTCIINNSKKLLFLTSTAILLWFLSLDLCVEHALGTYFTLGEGLSFVLLVVGVRHFWDSLYKRAASPRVIIIDPDPMPAAINNLSMETRGLSLVMRPVTG